MNGGDLGTFFLLGPSQAGKSKTCNTIAGSDVAGVGKGGISCTTLPEIYSCNSQYLQHSIQFIDIPGFNDSRLKLSNEQILGLIKLMFIEARGRGLVPKGFIIIESIPSELLKLKQSIEKIMLLCGENSKDSMVVLANKADLLEHFPEKYECILQECRNFRIPCVKWSNELSQLSERERSEQASMLIDALRRINPYNATWMAAFENELLGIAQKLADNQIRPTEQEVIDKAVNLAKSAPAISVQKTRTVMKSVRKVSPHVHGHHGGHHGHHGHHGGGHHGHHGGHHGHHGGGHHGHHGGHHGHHDKKPKEDRIYYVDEPFVETYTEMVQPEYSGFLTTARNSFVLKPADYFLPEAMKLKSQEIRAFLKSSG